MNILMVCLGNICRSPMAEGIMRQKIEKYKLNANVDSCGTANYHVNQSPDKRAIQTLLPYGIDISKHQGRQFVVSDFDKYDLIFAMDENNYTDILIQARNENDKKKVRLMMEENYPGESKEVPDPYFGNLRGFEETYNLLNLSCEALARRLAV